MTLILLTTRPPRPLRAIELRRKSQRDIVRQWGKLPTTRGWLITLVPEAAHYRNHLQSPLQDPEIIALMAAAPTAMVRPLRSLWWMLRITPPPAPVARRFPPDQRGAPAAYIVPI